MALIPPRRDQLLTADGLPTKRFSEYLEELGRQTNTTTTVVTTIASSSALALINDLSKRVGSGDALTSDETGFTVDSDLLSVDMTEA